MASPNSSVPPENNDLHLTHADTPSGSHVEHLDTYLNTPFDTICSTCYKTFDIRTATFIEQRVELMTLLRNRGEGVLLTLTAMSGNRDFLDDNFHNHLTQLLMDRELDIILKREKTSLENPLKSFS